MLQTRYEYATRPIAYAIRSVDPETGFWGENARIPVKYVTDTRRHKIFWRWYRFVTHILNFKAAVAEARREAYQLLREFSPNGTGTPYYIVEIDNLENDLYPAGRTVWAKGEWLDTWKH